MEHRPHTPPAAKWLNNGGALNRQGPAQGAGPGGTQLAIRLQALRFEMGPQLAVRWLDQDGAIGKEKRGDRSHTAIQTPDQRISVLIEIHVDPAVRRASAIEQPP